MTATIVSSVSAADIMAAGFFLEADGNTWRPGAFDGPTKEEY